MLSQVHSSHQSVKHHIPRSGRRSLTVTLYWVRACTRVPHNSLCGGDESTCRRPRITMLRYRIIISTSWQVRAPLCTPRQPPLRQALGLPGPPRGLRTGGRSAPPVAPPPSLTCSPSPPHQSVHLPLVARTAPHIMCTCACAHFSLSLSLQVELPAHVAAVRRSAVCACVCVCVQLELVHVLAGLPYQARASRK